MNIIVTGNNGLLGKSLTHKLLKNGHRVYGFSRHMAKDTVAVKHRNFKHIKVDLRRFKSVQDACNSIEDVKFIFHTATIHPAKTKRDIKLFRYKF